MFKIVAIGAGVAALAALFWLFRRQGRNSRVELKLK